MTSKKTLFYRFISVLLIVSILTSILSGCQKQNAVSSDTTTDETHSVTYVDDVAIDTESIADQITESIQIADQLKSENDIEQIVLSLIMDEYSTVYDVFPAAVDLDDGTEILGIGYSDFGSYFESEDDSRNYFAAGFIPYYGETCVPASEEDAGLVVYNLDYENEDYGFVYAYNTDAFLEHCVINGNYLKYGVDENGVITYDAQTYVKGQCDETLGALYSYDEERYLYNPNVGEYVNITGISLYESLDYEALEAEVNQILEDQDNAFSQDEVITAVSFAQEAVESYLLSCQSETFLGCDVDELIEQIKELDSTDFLRMTPEGYVVIPLEDDIPDEPSAVAKWVVGISCGIVVVASTALDIFFPAARPVSGAITSAAIEVFMQVVVENRAVQDIQWSKVAVSAASGALMAWACPLGASALTTSVKQATGNVALSKLAGYGVLTLSNAVVSGVTNAAFAVIDEKDNSDVFNAFLVGAAVGACCTAAASLLSEAGHALGDAAKKALSAKSSNGFLSKAENAGNAVKTFIKNHQVHLSNSSVEDILSPKSVYEAAQAANEEYTSELVELSEREETTQAENVELPAEQKTEVPETETAYDKVSKKGGKYSDLVPDGQERHEMPCFSSTGDEVRDRGPSIKMDPADHRQTASWGSSAEAREYQAEQKRLIDQGKYHEAIQMDIDDIHDKFGDKYDEAIEEMLEYAKSIGWW